ncbi:MAG: hypothetical protein GY803_25105 [Chloroflexi bacterium]|nr:hypothetical protein [Chloroflexota bacterium]
MCPSLLIGLGMNADSKWLRQPTLIKQSWLTRLWAALLNVAIYAVPFGILARRQQIVFHVLRARDVSLFGSLPRLATAVILISFLTTAVHELGHLLAGNLAGLRFHMLVIGPLRVAHEGGKLRFGLHKSAFVFSGMTGSAPTDSRNLSRRLLVFFLGGPLASLIQTALAAILFFHWSADVHFTNSTAWAVEAAAITAVYAAIVFLSAIKPSQYQSGQLADGGRIVSLLRGGPVADRWRALVALIGTGMDGQRPRDWDKALIQQALIGYDHSHDGRNARLVAYLWALDNGRIAEANRWLEEAIAIRPTRIPGTPAHLIWEKAYFIARHLNDPAQARDWLNRAQKKPTHQSQFLRAEAAVLMAEGNPEAARETAREALAILRQKTPTGMRRAESDWLQTIIAQT